MKKFLDLTDQDLINNKYDYDQIEYSILHNCISLRVLNRYQKLTPYICAKYVIFGGNEEKYGDSTEDCWLDDGNILYRQKHITPEELRQAHIFVENEENNEKRECENMKKEDIMSSYHNKCHYSNNNRD